MTSPAPKRLHSRGDPHPVFLGHGLAPYMGRRLAAMGIRRVAVITHPRLARLFGKSVQSSLEKAGIRTAFHFMPEGENAKCLRTVERLYDELVRARYSRGDAVLTLGGGVVGDAGGFVAATYLRGVPLVHVPTTLLAQIDSALGGKVGVNHALGKNLIGAFYQPLSVFIDLRFLATLPSRQLRSGLFELLKYGFIELAWLFRWFENAPNDVAANEKSLTKAIRAAVRLKLRIVREDEREFGLRRVLNFGHTIGHGLEAAGQFELLSHGEAVGWGMIAAVRLSDEMNLLPESVARRMERVVRSVGPLPSIRRLDKGAVMRAIDNDKKVGPRGIRFVLPVAIGRVTVVESVPREAIARAVERLSGES